MLKKFTKRYVKLHKCKLKEDEPSLIPETGHAKGFVLPEAKHRTRFVLPESEQYYGEEIRSIGDDREEDRHDEKTPRQASLIETIEKVPLARQLQQSQSQLALARDVVPKKMSP
ncbi:hypothetical protein TorRG33x02_200420 [Trema orientale]|uniref:Uncharacterized protein n=1 Tax=Trema orientale TaxID=63057 RepID=A0A2P5EF37_TREOI|nr:hypothetical protein TorRG33x02_200420 [Trema orientale]